MPGGTREKLHFHTNAQQFFFILNGVAIFYLDNEKEVVTEQSGILIKSKTNPYIANETNQSLAFLVIYNWLHPLLFQ
jgi:mannose-6-phosphate isomerase-like protein (cupin superfamily)